MPRREIDSLVYLTSLVFTPKLHTSSNVLTENRLNHYHNFRHFPFADGILVLPTFADFREPRVAYIRSLRNASLVHRRRNHRSPCASPLVVGKLLPRARRLLSVIEISCLLFLFPTGVLSHSVLVFVSARLSTRSCITFQ